MTHVPQFSWEACQSNQIALLATAPLIRSTGPPSTVQAYNYQIWNNTMPINNWTEMNTFSKLGKNIVPTKLHVSKTCTFKRLRPQDLHMHGKCSKVADRHLHEFQALWIPGTQNSRYNEHSKSSHWHKGMFIFLMINLHITAAMKINPSSRI